MATKQRWVINFHWLSCLRKKRFVRPEERRLVRWITLVGTGLAVWLPQSVCSGWLTWIRRDPGSSRNNLRYIRGRYVTSGAVAAGERIVICRSSNWGRRSPLNSLSHSEFVRDWQLLLLMWICRNVFIPVSHICCYLYVCVCVCACVSVHTCVYMCICVHTCVLTYVCLCVLM